MSLSSALSNAISGLNAASRSAQVVSSNISNALTEGYGRRDLEIEARHAQGGGVRAVSVTRHRDMALLADFRDASGAHAGHERTGTFFARLEQLIGTPDEASSLSARLASLESALVSASSRPDLQGRLDEVVQAFGTVAQSFSSISQGIQDQRIAADREIGSAVEALNSKLLQVQELNVQIAGGSIGGRDVSSLIDQREGLITDISEWIPLKQMARPNQTLALYSAGGAVLIDGSAAELGFSRTNMIVPHMTVEGGLLSGLEINGEVVSTSAGDGPLQGGRLAALFEIRDGHAVAAQGELDAMARDLVERFQDSAIDPTRAPGSAGALTDGGTAFDPANETGLSGRLRVNVLVDPSQGGASWRLRDGLGAAAQGEVGNGALLSDLTAALSAARPTASGSFSGSMVTSSDLVGLVSGQFAAKRLTAEQSEAFAAVRATEAEGLLLEDGVDSDQEMQKLMLIEQAYAANARILQTVDEMMNALMRAV